MIGTATFNYAELLYGGSTLDGEILANGSGASVTFNNGLVSQSLSEGFDCESGTINITNSLITGNNRGVQRNRHSQRRQFHAGQQQRRSSWTWRSGHRHELHRQQQPEG